MVPEETKATLSPECMDFMRCLLSGTDTRIGSSQQVGGFEQVVSHPWFKNFDFDTHSGPGPLIPAGCENMDELLE